MVFHQSSLKVLQCVIQNMKSLRLANESDDGPVLVYPDDDDGFAVEASEREVLKPANPRSLFYWCLHTLLSFCDCAAVE